MSYQRRVTKAADETVDVVLTFVPRLARLGAPADTITSYVVESDSGVVVETSALEAGSQAVRMFVSGGASGRFYTVFVEATTVGGRVLRADAMVKVRGGLSALGIVLDGGTGEDQGGGLVIDGGET